MVHELLVISQDIILSVYLKAWCYFMHSVMVVIACM